MSDLLFDTPWWLPTIIAFVGVILFVTGNRRQKTGVRTAGTAVLAAAVLLILVSYFVDTDKEKCLNGTRKLVQSVEQGDWKTFDSLLDPQATLELGGQSVLNGRDEITKAARAGVERAGLKSATITHKEAKQDGPLVTVSMRVFTTQDLSMGRPLDSDWELDWQQSNGQWLVRRIREVQVQGVSSQQLQRELPRQ